MRRRRGRLIVLEGGEGAGKSTHARSVAAWLRRRGGRAILTREPGGSPLAESIREVVLEQWKEGMDASTELLLMFAARAAHLHATIRPALEAGRDVVCDRFVDATYAYQGAGRGMPIAQIDTLASMVLRGLKPDLVLVLDLSPAQGATRVHKRGTGNRFDRERLRFARAVRKAYLHRAGRDPERYAVIDASQPQAEVGRAIRRELEQRL